MSPTFIKAGCAPTGVEGVEFGCRVRGEIVRMERNEVVNEVEVEVLLVLLLLFGGEIAGTRKQFESTWRRFMLVMMRGGEGKERERGGCIEVCGGGDGGEMVCRYAVTGWG